MTSCEMLASVRCTGGSESSSVLSEAEQSAKMPNTRLFPRLVSGCIIADFNALSSAFVKLYKNNITSFKKNVEILLHRHNVHVILQNSA